MAIIYSYPEKITPSGGDFLVITDSAQAAPNKNRTKSLTIDNLASYVISSTSGITGSGTIDAIPKFTPTGVKIGDSIMTEIGGRINVAGRLSVDNDLQVIGYSRFSGEVQDNTNNSGTSGQVLTSTGTGVAWDDASDIVSGAVTKLIPYFQTATPGGSATYTQSNNIVDFDWSGGSGTYEYILPSATAIPYRKIRFVNNSTITASTKVHITAPIGETIDGGAFYEINKAYNGCAVWSDGTEWIVIQAKA